MEQVVRSDQQVDQEEVEVDQTHHQGRDWLVILHQYLHHKEIMEAQDKVLAQVAEVEEPQPQVVTLQIQGQMVMGALVVQEQQLLLQEHLLLTLVVEAEEIILFQEMVEQEELVVVALDLVVHHLVL